MNEAYAINKILNHLGAETRIFIVDYKDTAGTDYNVEVNSIGRGNDELAVASLIDEAAQKGWKVTMITEILHGYNKQDIKEMTTSNPSEALKHIRIIYLISQKKGRRK